MVLAALLVTLAHFVDCGTPLISTETVQEQYYKHVPVDDRSELAFSVLDLDSFRSTVRCMQRCALFEDCVVAAVKKQGKGVLCSCLANLEFNLTSVDIWTYNNSWSLYAKNNEIIKVLVLRASKWTGDAVFSRWVEDEATNNVDLREACDISQSLAQTYKNGLIDTWEEWDIQTVEVSLVTNGTEVVKMVFDGRNTDKLSWFSTAHRIGSPWSDLNARTDNPFLINWTSDKSFAIKQFSVGCMMSGWMLVLETADTCGWSSHSDVFPQFFYSPTSSQAGFDITGDRRLADNFVIYLTLKLA